jgi:hypothetical protein
MVEGLSWRAVTLEKFACFCCVVVKSLKKGGLKALDHD